MDFGRNNWFQWIKVDSKVDSSASASGLQWSDFTITSGPRPVLVLLHSPLACTTCLSCFLQKIGFCFSAISGFHTLNFGIPDSSIKTRMLVLNKVFHRLWFPGEELPLHHPQPQSWQPSPMGFKRLAMESQTLCYLWNWNQYFFTITFYFILSLWNRNQLFLFFQSLTQCPCSVKEIKIW